MQKNKKSTYIKIISVILIVIIFLLGVTYAYFMPTIEGNKEASSVNVNAGNLELDFETSEYISNDSGELVKKENIETEADANNFKVVHTASSTVPAVYDLYLQDISISPNLKSPDFQWQLLKDNKVINSGDFSKIGDNTNLKITLEEQTLQVGHEDNYTFRIWLLETDEDQSSLYSGTFSAKIGLSATTPIPD